MKRACQGVQLQPPIRTHHTSDARTHRAYRYFYIPCRKEHRGIGGLFFDDVASDEAGYNAEVCVFVCSCVRLCVQNLMLYVRSCQSWLFYDVASAEAGDDPEVRDKCC